jgi:DUF4097 and DUF4098 domain-containing protein YvlB
MHASLRTTALIALVALPALAGAQTLVGAADSIYTWRGSLGTNGLLTIKNYNGPIDVRAASGTTAEVRAEKRTRGGDLRDVAFEVQGASGGGDVTICAVFRSHNPCDDGRNRDRDDWDDDRGRRSVTVSMTVLLPRGAQLRVATGNGAVSVEGVGGDINASTGNGRVMVSGTSGTVRVSTGNGDVDVRGARSSVRVSTGNGRVNVTTSDGPVEARTGNGDIDVTMSALKAAEDMTFSTGSGSVRLTLPSGYNGELDASTGNGEIRSDFELKIEGRLNPRRIRATIGNGGPRLRLSSGNGRLEIRKA